MTCIHFNKSILSYKHGWLCSISPLVILNCCLSDTWTLFLYLNYQIRLPGMKKGQTHKKKRKAKREDFLACCSLYCRDADVEAAAVFLKVFTPCLDSEGPPLFSGYGPSRRFPGNCWDLQEEEKKRNVHWTWGEEARGSESEHRTNYDPPLCRQAH